MARPSGCWSGCCRARCARGAAGVNVLIYGPPGTGKTELARTLAAEAGADLYAVGEVDADGEEPSRSDRLSALRRAQRLLARRGDALLLFDEMEDLFAEASLCAGGGAAGRRPRSSSTGCSRAIRCRRSGRATRSTWSIPRTCGG